MPYFGPPSLQLIQSQTFSAVASVDFLSGFTATFRRILFDGTDIICSGTAEIDMRVSTDAGSTFKAGATDYRSSYSYTDSGVATATVGGGNDTKFPLGFNDGVDPSWFEVILPNPSNTGQWSVMDCRSANSFTAVTRKMISSTQLQGISAHVNAVRFLPSAGTFSGKIAMFGLRV